MKHNKVVFVFMLVLLLALSLALSACGGTTPPAEEEAAPEPEATEVQEEPAEPAEEEEAAEPEEEAAEPEEEAEESTEPTVDGADPNALPRNETLYYNGFQWGAVVGWNPYSSSNNNGMAINQQDNARVVMFETPYLYNMLDGQVYPLLADGDYEWNDDRTEITFKLKSAAKWSDGTPVTAEDVAYTWATHVKYETPIGAGNGDYIDDIVAVDEQTVMVKAKLDKDGKQSTR